MSPHTNPALRRRSLGQFISTHVNYCNLITISIADAIISIYVLSPLARGVRIAGVDAGRAWLAENR